MDLKLEKRVAGKKSELSRIRREGNYPAVLYVKGSESVAVEIDGEVFQTHLRNMPEGTLATQIFNVELDGRKFKAITKDIRYHRTTYNIQHIDLMEVADEDLVSVHIPVMCKGVDRCLGITQGGQLKRVKRSVKVTVKVGEMPEVFTLDVTKVQLGESLRVKDVELTPSMKLGISKAQVLVAVSK